MAHVSFWLVPAEGDCALLQSMIGSLTQAHGAAPFLPHVTLYSGPSPDGISIEALLAEATQGLPPLELKIEDIRHSGVFTKTVFIQLANISPLTQLANRIREGVPNPSEYSFDPHVSLIYQYLDEATREQIAASISIPQTTLKFDQVQAIGSLDTFETQEDVRTLRCLCRQFLMSTTS